MTGRPRLDIGTFGTIACTNLAVGRVRAETRYRDDDGVVRKVTASGASRNDATAALKRKLLDRRSVGQTGGAVTAHSPFTDLAALWMESVRANPELSDGTKGTYERELRTLLLPQLKAFTVREITASRVERFVQAQRATSFARAKHTKALLSLVMAFAVRQEAVRSNPVAATTALRKPPRPPRGLTAEEIERIRAAAGSWRTAAGTPGPPPDGQVQDLIEVMLGTATRIGEALALRRCDLDLAAQPPTIHVAGTIVVHAGKPVHRQPSPKTASSNRVIAIPDFAADVLARRASLISDEEPEHLLFFTRRDTPLRPHNVRRTFRDILAKAGLEGRDIHPHSFRKTGATLLSAVAGDRAAADALGHTGVQMTRAHYIERAAIGNPATAEILQRLAPRGGDHASQ